MSVNPCLTNCLPTSKMLLFIFLIFTDIGFGLHQVNDWDLSGQLQRRQGGRTISIAGPPPGCTTPCAFFEATINCNTDPCVCTVWASTSQAVVATCADCIRVSNQTLAAQYLAQQQMCITALEQLSSTVTVTSPATEEAPSSATAAPETSAPLTSNVPTTSANIETSTPSPTALFTGGAAVKQVGVAIAGIAGLVAGILL